MKNNLPKHLQDLLRDTEKVAAFEKSMNKIYEEKNKKYTVETITSDEIFEMQERKNAE